LRHDDSDSDETPVINIILILGFTEAVEFKKGTVETTQFC